MENCHSKENAHEKQQTDNADVIEINKKFYQPILLAKKTLLMWFTATGDTKVKTS